MVAPESPVSRETEVMMSSDARNRDSQVVGSSDTDFRLPSVYPPPTFHDTNQLSESSEDLGDRPGDDILTWSASEPTE